jgi:hypothetical protein
VPVGPCFKKHSKKTSSRRRQFQCRRFSFLTLPPKEYREEFLRDSMSSTQYFFFPPNTFPIFPLFHSCSQSIAKTKKTKIALYETTTTFVAHFPCCIHKKKNTSLPCSVSVHKKKLRFQKSAWDLYEQLMRLRRTTTVTDEI